MLMLVPAYGRDYANAKAVKADWVAGKDFTISGKTITLATAALAEEIFIVDFHKA